MAKHKPFISKDLEREYAYQCSRTLWHWAKRNNPLAKKNSLDGSLLFIDSESIINHLIITGKRLHANEIKGFRAPINKREKTRRHVAFIYGDRFRYIDTKTKFGEPGVYIHDMEYHGKRITNGFFGVKMEGIPRAYGITDDGSALPAYSFSIPQWMIETQGDEISRILGDTFTKVFQKTLTDEGIS